MAGVYTRPWMRTRASGEPKARPWQPGPGQDEAGGREGGEIHDPAGAFVGSAVISGAGGQGRLSLGPYLEFIARMTSHIPDKGQVVVRYYGLYANAHRGKVRKASHGLFPSGLLGRNSGPSLPGAGPP